MRNEKLTAYSLHHKTYRDKRSLYYLFTREFGIIHGIGKRGIPQFVPLTLFASGKSSLKTLQQVNANAQVTLLEGSQQYAALYVNEVLLKLVPIEDPSPQLFDTYEMTITHLRQALLSAQLRLVLRLFEHSLFKQLGYSFDFYQDIDGQPIASDFYYQFIINEGWRAQYPANMTNNSIHSKDVNTKDVNTKDLVIGSTIINMQAGINPANLALFSWLHRQLIDHLFDYKPLQSRLLWQQYNQYR